MSAFESLSQKNGLKATKTVLNKQQSGVDAVQKANPQVPTFTMAQLNNMKADIDKENNAIPADETPSMREARIRTIGNQKGVANGIRVNYGVDANEQDKPDFPVAKKPQPVQPKQMSYAEMFKFLNPEAKETPEQKAKREKREKRNAVIAAIGDGLRALSNMYFSTKGAKVVHDPQTDISPIMQRRKQMIDAQREKNRAAWLSGYQRALALDEEARKNKATLAEQMRYHDIIAKNNDVKNDLSQQRIDLSKIRITNQKEYNDARLKLDEAFKKGQISIQERRLAIQALNAQASMIRAKKSGSGRSGGGKGSSKVDWDEEYMKLYGEDPKAVDNAAEQVAGAGIKPTTTAGRKQIVKKVRAQKAAKPAKENNGGASNGNWASGLSLK